MILVIVIVVLLLLVFIYKTSKDKFVTCNDNQITIQDQCYNCPTYSTYDSNTGQCTKCINGYYLSGGTCNKCPDGTISSEGSLKCDTCPAGTYSNSTECIKCPDGTISSAGSLTCITCPSGYSTGKECLECPDGTIPNGSSCMACPLNTYSNGSSCIDCPSDTYSNNGLSCIPIPVCTGTNILVNNECVECPQNYIPNANRTACVCPAGKISNHNNTYCIQDCNIGYYNNPYYNGNNCMLCNAGTASNVRGVESCLSCPDGTYSIAGSETCTSCPKGTYGNTDATNCTDCGYGKYNDQLGQMSCTNCPSGTTTSITNAQSSTDCNVIIPEYVSCDAGMYFDSVTKTCRTCHAGYYTPTAGYTACTACPPGQTSWNFMPTSCY